MEHEIIFKKINTISTELSQIQQMLKSIKITNHVNSPEFYENITVEAALKSERITCKLRHIIYATLYIVKKPELMKKAADVHGIEISYNDGIFKVIVPALLPKKNKSLRYEFMRAPLYYALEEYFAAKNIERFEKCVVVFEHIYAEETPDRLIRDHDNIDLKALLDTVGTFVMKDDGGKYCNIYNMTEYGKKDCTSISIMKQDKFIEWLSERENR